MGKNDPKPHTHTWIFAGNILTDDGKGGTKTVPTYNCYCGAHKEG